MSKTRYAVACLVTEPGITYSEGVPGRLTLRIIEATSREEAEHIGVVCCEGIEQTVVLVTASQCERITNS